MKKIKSLLNSYAVRKEQVVLQNHIRSSQLKEHIQLSKQYLHELRLYLRSYSFESKEDEIEFFKYVKPKLSAELIFYTNQLAYLVCKPNSTVSFQKAYIKSKLKKLESQKRKNLQFYRYYKHGETFLDDKYFIRGNDQLELFVSQQNLYPDPEFFTSHDMFAAKVISYDFLTEFYKKELLVLKNIETGVYDTKNTNVSDICLCWTASKTDLIELIYALKVSGAINGGTGQVKQITESMEALFNIDLGNYYKTYSEIKNRSKERTKFLLKLVDSLLSKLDYDDGL